MYAAQVQAAFVRMALGTAVIEARVGEINSRADIAAMDARVRAVIEYAQMLGQQAAAGLNALHGSTIVGASTSSSL
jgi:hypothetical protein